MHKRFTNSEKLFVHEHFQTKGARWVAAQLGRTISSVQHRFYRGPNARQSRYGWKPHELAYLREHYEIDGAKDVGAHLGRSEAGIRHKAERLGIKANDAGRGRQRETIRAKFLKQGFKDPKIWNDEVKKRDHYACQWCGFADADIVEAHHIVPVGQGGSRLDIANGITLCPICHAYAHLGHTKLSGKRVTPEVYAEIKRLKDEGKNISEITAVMTLNKKTVRYHYHK